MDLLDGLLRSAGRQDEVKRISGGGLVQSFGAIYGFGPRYDVGELDGIGLRFQVEFGAAFGDFGVEGLDAEAEAFGLGAARAVVFGRGKAGETGEGC